MDIKNSPHSEPQLSSLTDDQRDLATKKYKIIEAYLNGESSLTNICNEHDIPTKTASTWVSKYREFGLVGLARKPRSDQGERRVGNNEIIKFIEGLHLKKPHLSYANIYRQAKKYANNKNIEMPSYKTVCTLVSKISNDLKILAHKGQAAYKQQFELLYIRESSKPNEIWQADHTMLDILLTHHKNPEGCRPWLTIVIDDYSRAIAGYELSFDAPSAQKTSLAFRHAIWRKKEPSWSICGIPETFYTDHGSDFTSKHIEQVCIDLKIKLIFSAIGEPRGRGKVERFFLTINQMLLSNLDGYIGSKSPHPTLSLDELREHMQQFIIEYNTRVHSTTKEEPKNRWEKSGFLPRMPSSLDQLDLLLLSVAKRRMVNRDGIRFEGLRYLDPILAEYIGVSVTIRYDPSDMTSIRVFHNSKFLCQPICHDLDNQSVSLKEIQTARARRRYQLSKQIDDRISLVDAVLLNKPRKQKKAKTISKNKKQESKSTRKLKLYINED